MKYNFILSRTPFKFLWRVWNPLRLPDSSGGVIADIKMKMKSKKTSKIENSKREKEGKRGPKRWTIKVTQSIDLSGKSN